MSKQNKTRAAQRDTSVNPSTAIPAFNLPTEEALREVFPNNPLKQVAFEIRFQRSLRILRNIADMQEQLGDIFTFSGREGIIFPNEPPASLYSFTHVQGNLTLKAGEDRFAVLVTKYEAFEVFVAEVMEWTTRFCSLFKISSFKRVGLRYVNHISIPFDQTGLTLEKYVKPYVDIERIRPARLRQFSTELLTDNGDCKFNIRTGSLLNSPERGVTYILDLDAFIEDGTTLPQLDGVMQTLHKQAQIEFLTHVTEDYKSVMRRKS